jgi:hypothetical protein
MPFPLMTAHYLPANRTAAFRKPTIRTRPMARKSTRVKHAAARIDTAVPHISRRAGTVAVPKTVSNVSTKGRRAHAAKAASAASSSDDDRLKKYYNAASMHSKNLRTSPLRILMVSLTILFSESLAAQSSSVQDDDSGDFHQQAASELTAFHTNMLGLQTLLTELGADKGLANDDRTDDLETLLKNVINVNKDTLSYVTTITYNLPLVGKTLGPSEHLHSR